MIDRPASEPVMSPQAAKLAFLSATTVEDMREAMRLIRKRALREIADDEDNSNWMRLLLEYTVGRARTSKLLLAPLELPDMSTLDGVHGAIQAIAEAQASGLLPDDDADSYRKTVALALQALRTGQAARIEQHLDNGGAVVFYGGADKDPEELGRDFAEVERARRAALEN